MKVNPNDPTLKCISGVSGLQESSIPVRLEIAAKLLAGMYASGKTNQSHLDVPFALHIADQLIKEHNNTYGLVVFDEA